MAAAMAANLVEHILEGTTADRSTRTDVAYLLSLISAWSYSDCETLKKILHRDTVAGPYASVTIAQHSVRNSAFPVDVNAFLISFSLPGHPHPLQVLCFRGTELTNIIDLLTDALVEPHPWPKRRTDDEWVHRGFFLSLDVLWPELSTELRSLHGDLYLTGHSLGGALAVLAGRRFVDDGIDGPVLRAVVTIGQPMVGGGRFRDRWPASIPLHRYVFRQDLVVRLPPRLSDDGQRYHHFGRVYMPEAPGDAVWSELDPDRDAVSLADASTPCEGFDILPAFLTLITTRAPSLPTELLELVANLPTAGRWIRGAPLKLWRGQRVVPASRYSLNDHAPTYYVDAARRTWKQELAASRSTA
jgi:hypothetical protein